MKLLAHPFSRIYVACAVAGLALAVVMFAELTMKPSCEVVLVAPESALPGTRVPVRVNVISPEFAFRDVPRLRVPVRVELRSPPGEVIASSRLVSVDETNEGELLIPSGASGDFALVAIAEGEGGGERAEKPFFVGRRSAALATRPRSLVGVPETMRIGGGACVPESPCDVYVSSFGERRVVVPTGAFEPCEGEARDERTAALCGVVHGPDARICLRAGDESFDAAECEFRGTPLPVVLGEPTMRVKRAVVRAGTDAEFELFQISSAGSVLVDIFEDGRWIRATHAPVEDPSELRGRFRLRMEKAGRFCVQAYMPDSWGSSVATRCLDVVEGVVEGDVSAVAPTRRFELAAFELDTLVLPEPVNGLEASLRALESEKARVRYVALALVVVLAGLIAIEVMRTARSAAKVARDVMAEAGDDASQRLARVSRDRLEVAGLTLLVFVVVLSVVAFVLVRKLF